MTTPERPAFDDLFDTYEAAQYLNISPGTLTNWRSKGIKGPAFIRVGKSVRYQLADLQEFINQNRVT